MLDEKSLFVKAQPFRAYNALHLNLSVEKS
jgi:hypothetical protein